MDDNKLDCDKLLNMIAESMGGKVVTWNTVNETITKNISFARIVSTSKYISKEEREIIEQRSYVGEIQE
ncbi:hypothetical protein ACJDT4_09365 [Clostridium neuense]|uniref:Uncharacterized protein n=1 Tax=Clostridium neuense TaxID=1728934 RepID=A0ABW8TFV7_9CLOT